MSVCRTYIYLPLNYEQVYFVTSFVIFGWVSIAHLFFIRDSKYSYLFKRVSVTNFSRRLRTLHVAHRIGESIKSSMEMRRFFPVPGIQEPGPSFGKYGCRVAIPDAHCHLCLSSSPEDTDPPIALRPFYGGL